MARQSTGKRTRFEVFKRDHFTCQYCGAQPPTVVLVVDHIVPVAAGGESTIDNLIAACEPCNQGKAGDLLGVRQIRPDADLLYLEAQQEIAEHRRFQAAMAAKEAELARTCEVLIQAWYRAAPELDWSPADHLVVQMLRKYPPPVVYEALVDVAGKIETGYLDIRYQRTRWIPYLWAVARNAAEASGDA